MAFLFDGFREIAETDPEALSIDQLRLLSRVATSKELGLIIEESLKQEPPNVQMATLVTGLCIGKLDTNYGRPPGHFHGAYDGRETLESARLKLASAASNVVPAINDVPQDAIRVGNFRQQR